MSNVKKYLEVSPYQVDGGEKIGKIPSLISISDLRDLGHPESYPKIIRAKCEDCVGGEKSEIRKCVQFSCPLWPIRMGINPFHTKRKRK